MYTYSFVGYLCYGLYVLLCYVYLCLSMSIYLGKLQYFTNLNLAAIKGDDSPY